MVYSPSRNLLDRMIEYISPGAAQRRLQARLQLALSESYIGARTDRRQTSQWSVSSGDADRDVLSDLPTLRARSRDLYRNTPLATGAINTVITNVVGTGLRFYSRIDRAVLGMSMSDADEWEANVEREFALWAESTACDIARGANFFGLQELVFRQVLECGEAFTLLPRVPLPGHPYALRIQIIEPDRVCNKDRAPNSDSLIAGVEKDKNGAPVAYHIMRRHPGAMHRSPRWEWDIVPAFGARTGLRNILHTYRPVRPGQTRGVPYLAPVIEPLKQLDRYTEAELMAAVVGGMFTVFIKSEGGQANFADAESNENNIKLGSGAIVGLAPGEDITVADPKRPNTAFDPFIQAIMRQIGVALEIPFEILIKHFTASYSAARAALLEAWKFFSSRRHWLATSWCQPIYEVWLYEAIASGRISAPGYFDDPLVRRAYSGAEWIGPGKGMIDEKAEITAAQMRVNMGVSTLDEETAKLGGNWEQKHWQSVKEHRMRQAAGLPPYDLLAPTGSGSAPGQTEPLPD